MKREIIVGPRAAYLAPVTEVLSLDGRETVLTGSQEFTKNAQNDTWEEFEFHFDD